jgi:hypothetical protein
MLGKLFKNLECELESLAISMHLFKRSWCLCTKVELIIKSYLTEIPTLYPLAHAQCRL